MREVSIRFCKNKDFLGDRCHSTEFCLEKREYYAALKMNKAVLLIPKWKGLPHTLYNEESKCDILL